MRDKAGAPPPPAWRDILSVLLPFARPERGWLAAIVVIGLLLSFAEGIGLTVGLLLVYRLLGANDSLGGDGAIGGLIERLAGLDLATLLIWAAALMLASSLLGVASALLSEQVANRITHRVRTRIYETYLRISYRRASAHGHGEMLDTLDYETPFLTQAVMNAANVVISVCAIAVYGGYIMLLSWHLGVAAVMLAVLLGAALGLASRRLSALGGLTSGLNERLLAHTIATVQGMRTVRLHAAEDEFIRRYGSSSAALAAAHVRVATLHSMIGAARQVGKILALGALIWVAVRFAVPISVTLAVVALLVRLVPHVAVTEEKLLDLFQFTTPLGILASAIDRSDDDLAQTGQKAFSGFSRELRFDGVSFSHNEDVAVLRDASFVVNAGDLVTIRGPSGGGKTTLINLVARLFDPQQGTILIDGVPLGDIDRSAWLDRIGFSGQDIDLQDGTILDNVRFFDTRISEEDARWALVVAKADEFVAVLPETIHAQVGDRGLRLSGGQRQRIGLARAIARRPDLLILDEATNAVDSMLEAEIYRSIRAALPKATILVITHKSTVAGAIDEWMLEKGRLTRSPAVRALEA